MSEPKNNLKPLLDRVDRHGFCIVWHVAERKWKRLSGADAKEQYVAGIVTIEDPDGSQPPAELKAKSVWPHGRR